VVSFLEKVEREIAKIAAAQNVDPWQPRLERVRGQVGDDGIERISTQMLFDFLEGFLNTVEEPGRAAVWRG